MGRHHHLPVGPDVVGPDPPDGGQVVCHDRPMAVRAAPAVPERRSRRGRRVRRTTLFRRLFLTYVAVVGLAVAVLVLAPITVSVPTALAELAVILGGFAVTLVLFHAFLRRALAPLQTLTDVMHQIDPLAPGQRIDATTGDEEVVALAEAFNEMLDRLEGERRDSGRRALAAQEAERRRIARELHDEIGQLLTGLILRGETLGTARSRGDSRGRRRAPRGRPGGGGGGPADRAPAASRGARRARAPERAAGALHDGRRAGWSRGRAAVRP